MSIFDHKSVPAPAIQSFFDLEDLACMGAVSKHTRVQIKAIPQAKIKALFENSHIVKPVSPQFAIASAELRPELNRVNKAAELKLIAVDALTGSLAGVASLIRGITVLALPCMVYNAATDPDLSWDQALFVAVFSTGTFAGVHMLAKSVQRSVLAKRGLPKQDSSTLNKMAVIGALAGLVLSSLHDHKFKAACIGASVAGAMVGAMSRRKRLAK